MYEVTKNSTQHGFDTPHGFSTPHKFPTQTSDSEELLGLVNELYPTGRAWNMPEKSVISNFHKAINTTFLRVLNDLYSTIDSSFPDNPNFTEEDCYLWEYKLGLNTNESLSLERRREIIYLKMAYPDQIPERQSRSYIEEQLNLYGFEVGVYENRFYDENGQVYRKTPSEIIETSPVNTQHGDDTLHGNSLQHGTGSYSLIANSIEDENYSIGGNENLWATFFIASKNSLYNSANIPSSRKNEFRELVLKLKPAHLVAFTFINY